MGTVEIVVLLFFLTLLISFLGSISGVGGGVLYVPLLLLILGSKNSLDEIKFISTFLVFVSATFNVILEYFRKNINYIIIIASIACATPAIILGNYLNSIFNPLIMQIIIIIFLILVTVLLIISEYVFKKKANNKVVYKESFLLININKQKQTKVNILKISLIAFFAGIITSLTGMGGGPIIMPALILLCYLSMKEAAPISHTIIMVSSLINLIFDYKMFTNSTITLNYLLPLSFAAIGSTIAAFYLKKYFTKEIYIKWLLIILIWISIIKMIIDIV